MKVPSNTTTVDHVQSCDFYPPSAQEVPYSTYLHTEEASSGLLIEPLASESNLHNRDCSGQPYKIKLHTERERLNSRRPQLKHP